jgi:hypothetical protein
VDRGHQQQDPIHPLRHHLPDNDTNTDDINVNHAENIIQKDELITNHPIRGEEVPDPILEVISLLQEVIPKVLGLVHLVRQRVDRSLDQYHQDLGHEHVHIIDQGLDHQCQQVRAAIHAHTVVVAVVVEVDQDLFTITK